MYCQSGQVERTAECLVELEKRCRNTRQEVEVLSERQETSKNTMEDKLKLQSRATERYHDQIFEDKGEKCQKKLCYLCRSGMICGDVRMRGMKQEGCRVLEIREG